MHGMPVLKYMSTISVIHVCKTTIETTCKYVDIRTKLCVNDIIYKKHLFSRLPCFKSLSWTTKI